MLDPTSNWTQAFQVGQQIAGNPMEQFVTGIVQRLNQHMQIQQQMNMQLALEPELKRRETLAQLGAYKEARESGLLPNYNMFGQQPSATGNQNVSGAVSGRASGVSEGDSHIGELGITGGELNPLTQMFTPRVGETPRSEMERAEATEATKQARTTLSGFGKPLWPTTWWGGGIAASPRAQKVISGMPYYTETDIPALQNAVSNGVFSKEDLPHLAQAFSGKFPNHTNPFEQGAGQMEQRPVFRDRYGNRAYKNPDGTYEEIGNAI